jgi:hypothetical protein
MSGGVHVGMLLYCGSCKEPLNVSGGGQYDVRHAGMSSDARRQRQAGYAPGTGSRKRAVSHSEQATCCTRLQGTSSDVRMRPAFGIPSLVASRIAERPGGGQHDVRIRRA